MQGKEAHNFVATKKVPLRKGDFDFASSANIYTANLQLTQVSSYRYLIHYGADDAPGFTSSFKMTTSTLLFNCRP